MKALGPTRSKTFVKRKNGVSRIVRDSYGSNWHATTASVALRDGKRCFDCGTNKPEDGPYETHHIFPLERGGTTSKANLKYLCRRCHDKKHPHHKIARGAARTKRKRRSL